MFTQYQNSHLYIGLFAILAGVGGSYVLPSSQLGQPQEAPFEEARLQTVNSEKGASEQAEPQRTTLASQNQLHGQKAPDFELERMNGETFRLSDHRGEVIVVNFWATWCPPCKKEIPGFVKLQEEFSGEGLTFVGVSLDEEGFEVVRPFAEKMSINYPLVVDDGSVAQKYGGVRALPTSFVVGPEGDIQYARPGFLPKSELRAQLTSLLKEAEPSS